MTNINNCELCGAALGSVGANGYHRCYNCGAEYVRTERGFVLSSAVELVTDTAKADKSDKLERLYRIARTVRDSGKLCYAAKYYELILKLEPTSWEASFYYMLGRATEPNGATVESSAYLIDRSIGDVIKLIGEGELSERERVDAIDELANRLYHVRCDVIKVKQNPPSGFDELALGTSDGLDRHLSELDACNKYALSAFSAIERYFSGDRELMRVASMLAKQAASDLVLSYNNIVRLSRSGPAHLKPFANDKKYEHFSSELERIADMIRRYDPNYAPGELMKTKRRTLREWFASL